jgi:GntR family transcriptional regulator
VRAGPVDQQQEYMARMRQRASSGARVRQRSPLRLHGLIRSGIRLGLLPCREQLVEDQLVQAYATSRNAVREAMSLLAEEGLVTRSPRHGTVVVGGIAEMALEDISPQRGSLPAPATGFQNPDDFQNTMLEIARIPITPLLRARLQTSEQAVWVAEWITLRAGEPLAIFTNYWLGAGVQRELGTDALSEGLEATFLRTYGRPLGRIDTSVESVMCDERTGRVLRIEPGSPLLFRERLLMDVDGLPREYNHTFFAGNKVALRTTTVSAGSATPGNPG